MILKILPFIISISLELLSPTISSAIEKIIDKQIKYINLLEDQATCKDLMRFSNDIMQLIPALLLSLVSFMIITCNEIKLELLVLSNSIIFVVFTVIIIVTLSSNPCKWKSKHVFYWSRKTIAAICLNLFLIVFVIFLPELKIYFPNFFNP